MKLLGKKRAKDEQLFVDMREAPRFSLMMRTAKLIGESGEYVCIVRDISATGTKLRLFHDAPPDTHLLLELANGHHYPIERVWLEGEHAGFRFASPIAVEEFVEETSRFSRRPLRLRLQRPSLVTADGRDLRAMLVNLSQQGACIEVSGELPVRQQVRLEVPGLPLRFGHVCWRKKFTHGLVFQQSFRLDELARLAFELQPFVPAPEPDAEDDSSLTRYA